MKLDTVRITKSEYCGSPCFKLQIRGNTYGDLDWNTRRPGLSWWMGMKPLGNSRHGFASFCLDLNAPLGEPHRLHLNIGSYAIIIGLLPGNGTQTWDWKKSEWTYRWSWFSVFPRDHRKRWDESHPDEASRRKARLRATGGRWSGWNEEREAGEGDSGQAG